MSAVVEAVGDLVGGVVDAVGDAVEWVGDTVSNVVESVMDDPLKAVVQVAAVATGNAWALPIIEGVDVLEEGGSIEDALKGAALTYAVQTGVNFAIDSFGAAGATADVGSGTTQFFDDGSSIQFFDDGSQLITDSSGAVSSTPAVDISSAGVQPTGAETFPVADPSQIVATDLPPADAAGALSPENIPLVTATPSAAGTEGAMLGYDQAMADLAASAQQAAVTPTVMQPGSMPTMDAQPLASQAARDIQYETIEDLMYERGLIDDAQYKSMTGKAPVVDLSTPASPMSDTSVLDAAKGLGEAALDYAVENPWTTAGVIGGGLALTGALGEPEQPAAPGEPDKKTYTYGPGAPINRTGLEEMWSAASKIYGGDSGVMKQLGIEEPKFQSSFKPNEAPLLSGQAAGAGKVGLGALGQGFSYTPMGQPKTFDISTLTPEQIVQLQDMVARKKTDGGV